MKRIITLIACACVLALPGFGKKLDRSKAPEPGPAPEIKIGAYQFFEMENGLKVYVVENHKLPTLSVSLRLNNDPVLEKDKVGYIEATGQLLMRGTTTRTKLQLDQEIDFLGARIMASSNGLYAGALSKHSEPLFELISDIILHPAFPEPELAKIKKQMDAGLKSIKTDPQQILSRVKAHVLFGKDHPYGEILTDQSLKAFSVEDCRNYYNTYFRPNVGYLSIVGDITLPKAKALVAKYLSKWERKEVPHHTYDAPAVPDKTQVIIVNKEGAVQTVLALSAPEKYSINAPDYLAGRVMTFILGGGGGRRLYNNLREDKGLTYGAYSQLEADKLIGSFNATAQVRNEVTAEAIKAFKFEFDKIRDEPVPAEELAQVKSRMAGAFAMSLEHARTVSRFAITTAIYNLPADFYTNYLKNLEAVSIKQISESAKKFVPHENGYIFAIGNADALKKDLAEFGEIHVLDVNGEPVSEMIPIPEGMTADKVIEDYLQALGGKDKLKLVKTLASKGTFATMGMDLQYSEARIEPGKFTMEIQMNGQSMVKQVINGDKGYIMQMGQKKDFTPEELKKMKTRGLIFPELHLKELGDTMELIGIEAINDKNAYKVKFTDESGDAHSVFYDMDSHLKVKIVSSQDTPQGSIPVSVEINEYKEVDGVKIPCVTVIQQGTQNMKQTLTEILVNTKIDESIFAVQ